MNWTTHINDGFWKVESNATIGENKEFYRWEKSFVMVTCKDVVNQGAITINDIRYEFFADDEVLIVEVTDLIRAYSGGSINFVQDNALLVYELEWVAKDGERPTANNTDILPDEIPFDSANSNPFYFQCTEAMQKTVSGTWIDFNTSGILSYDAQDLETLQVRTKTGGNVTSFIDEACWTDKILVEWLGRFGQLKSWWFTVDKIVNTSDKQINLQVVGDGFSTLKNKRISLAVSHKKADSITQQYLSDIVLSDAVYVYDDTEKNQVRIENTSFEVGNRKADINLIINKLQYDTI